MSTTEVLTSGAASDGSQTFEYRAISTRAIASLVLGIISQLIFVGAALSLQKALVLSPIAIVSGLLGLTAMRQIRADPRLYSGAKLAGAGLLLSLVSLAGGLGYASYVYATEVPPDHQRISFAKLRPDEVDQRAGRKIPEEVAALDGKKVFIKGYMRPDSTPMRTNVKRFLLVRDNNQCCFGDLGSVKYFDQVGVEVAHDVRLDKSLNLLRMAGTLHVDKNNAAAGSNLVFRLDADYAK